MVPIFMNIIILTENDQYKKNIYKISNDRFIHIKKILKSEVDDFVEVGLLNGPAGTAKIIAISEAEILLEICELRTKQKTKPKVDIICALPRPQTLKKVLNTCATMGIDNLYLIRSEKVEKSYFHSPLLKEENYTKYLIEGLSQGKRTDQPKVSIHNRFKVFFEKDFEAIRKNSICLLAHPDTNNYLNKISLDKQNNIALAIGPEGGWNEFETTLMEEKGFIKFRLSESILRVENAVTAALSQVELLTNANSI
jgi:16S rRNA (uracil1498-N3)-methyltransferase